MHFFEREKEGPMKELIEERDDTFLMEYYIFSCL